jgi:O-antigen/teichoic acid export membrane protein
MPILKSLLGRSNFVKNISYVSLGSIAAQAISLAASVFLTRLYSPEEFGEFSVVLSISSVIAIVATLRLETAIPLAKDDGESKRIAEAALFSVFICTVFIVLALAIAETSWNLTRASNIEASRWLVPAFVSSTAAWSVMSMLQSRRGNFSGLSLSTVSSSAIQNLGQILAGVTHAGALGLSAGYVVGRAWNVGVLSRGSGIRINNRFEQHWSTIKRWRRMPLMTMLPSLLNMLSVGSVALFVASFYGNMFAGYFALAVRILALPAALLGQAVRTVFYPKTAEVERNGNGMKQLIETATTALVVAAVPVFGLILLLGPEIFELVFGSEWRYAGTISALLAPWLGTSFISSPLSGLVTVKDQLGRLLALSFVETTIRLSSLYLGVFFENPMAGIAAYSLVGAFTSICYIIWALRLAGSKGTEWVKAQAAYLAITCTMYSVLLLTKGMMSAWIFVTLAILLTAGMLLYAGIWTWKTLLRPRARVAVLTSAAQNDQ